jgi:tryptophan synthase alpha chain
MSDFFAPRNNEAHSVGLAVFANAGDPPLSALTDLAVALDESGIDVLELAIPFPDSPTDGATIRRSARRALIGAIDLDATLAWVDTVRPRLTGMKIALFTDWSYTIRPIGLGRYLERVADSAADATLVHGLNPTDQQELVDTAGELGLPIVTTCYPTSPPNTIQNSAATASAFLYLVAQYGRSGAGGVEHKRLAPMLGELREWCERPIAVGFGVSSAADVRAIELAGADAAIIGSAFVEVIERSVTEGADLVSSAASFVAGLRTPAEPNLLAPA